MLGNGVNTQYNYNQIPLVPQKIDENTPQGGNGRSKKTREYTTRSVSDKDPKNPTQRTGQDPESVNRRGKYETSRGDPQWRESGMTDKDVLESGSNIHIFSGFNMPREDKSLQNSLVVKQTQEGPDPLQYSLQVKTTNEGLDPPEGNPVTGDGKPDLTTGKTGQEKKGGNLLSLDNLQDPPLVLSRGISLSDKDQKRDELRNDQSGGLSGKPEKTGLSGKDPGSSFPGRIPDNWHLDDVKEDNESGNGGLEAPQQEKREVQQQSGLQKSQFIYKLYNEDYINSYDRDHMQRFSKYYFEYKYYLQDKKKYSGCGCVTGCIVGFSRKSTAEEKLIDKMRIQVLAADLSNVYHSHFNTLETHYGKKDHHVINMMALSTLNCDFGSNFDISNDEYKALKEEALYRAQRDWMKRNPERVRKFENHGSIQPGPRLDQPGS